MFCDRMKTKQESSEKVHKKKEVKCSSIISLTRITHPKGLNLTRDQSEKRPNF